MAKFEYKTEVLTSMVGREKLRIEDLHGALKRYGEDGWELVSLNLDASMRGRRDGHLLIFKRAMEESSVTASSTVEREAPTQPSDAWARGWADAARSLGEEK